MNFTTAPSYSIKGTGKKAIYQLTGEDYASPGPIYNTTELCRKQSVISHKLGKSARYQINHRVEKNPGPGTYNPEKKHEYNIQNTIPKSKLLEKFNNGPAAANYQPKESFIKPKVLAWSMGSGYPGFMDKNNKNPGPTDYDNTKINSILRNNRKSKFGSASRFSQPKLSLPGPGQYNLTSRQAFHKAQGKFGTSQRPITSGQNTPGPNQYNKFSFADEINKSKKTVPFGKRLASSIEAHNLTQKAFGSYQIGQYTKLSMRSKSLGKFDKDQRAKNKRQKKPGVGEYDIDKFQTKQSKKVGFKKSTYDPHLTYMQNPGPGQYEVKQEKSTIYSIGRSKSAASIVNNPQMGRYQTFNVNPGVGKYKIQTDIKDCKTYTIGTSNRTNFVCKNKAGVGDYNIQLKKQDSLSFSKAKRIKQLEKTPGPGDYNLQSTIGNVNYYSKYVS